MHRKPFLYLYVYVLYVDVYVYVSEIPWLDPHFNDITSHTDKKRNDLLRFNKRTLLWLNKSMVILNSQDQRGVRKVVNNNDLKNLKTDRPSIPFP